MAFPSSFVGLIAPSGLITANLIFNLDAGNINSYPGTGTTWTDLSGNGINGTLTNGPTYNSSNGGSIVFTNSTNYVNFLQNSLFNFGTSDFTIEAWIYPTSFTGDPTIFMINPYSSSSNSGILFYVQNTGMIRSYYGNTTSFGNTTVSLNTWSHVVLTRVSGINYIYVNNNLPFSTTTGGTFNVTGNTNAAIGRDLSYNSSPWIGRIAIVRAYSAGFSAADVNQNFNGFRGRYGI